MRKVIITLVLVSIVSFAFAQDQYLRRDIKANMSLENTRTYTLDIFNGLSFPQGELNHFLKDGFNSGILIHKRFGKKLSIGLSANHSRFNHKQSFGPVQSSKRHELSTTSFDIGPQYNLNIGRFTLEFYGRSGLSIVNSPQSFMMYPETDIMITSLEAYKSTALTTRLGANMTANISQGLNLYFSSEYLTSLNSDMNYQTRDLAEAFRTDGTLDPDAANKLPYRNESLSLSMLNVNFGIRISIGGNGHKRKNKSGRNLMYEGRAYQNNLGYGQWVSRAQDYNSGRGDNSSTIAPDANRSENDIGIGDHIFSPVKPNDSLQSRTQDYMSIRSMNSSIIAPDPDENESRLDSQSASVDEAGLVDIPEEKLKLKTKAQLAKERRKKKRLQRRMNRLKAKL